MIFFILTDCTVNIDTELVILLDASDSIGSSIFSKMISQTINLVRGLPGNFEVGVIRFSNTADVISGLVPSSARHDLLVVINATKFVGGKTGIDIGIHQAISLFTQVNENCKRSRKIILIMSDGKSDDLSKSLNAANYAKRLQNIQIYGLEMGKNIFKQELRLLVSNPYSDYFYELKDACNSKDVDMILSRLNRSLCKGECLGVSCRKILAFSLFVILCKMC